MAISILELKHCLRKWKLICQVRIDFKFRLTNLDNGPKACPEFENMKLLSSKLQKVNYELVKSAKDRFETKLEIVERELFFLKRESLKLTKKNRVLERRLRSNQTQMKELLLCDQKRKIFFTLIMIVFSGNTSRISNIRGTQSPLFDDTELSNINLNLGLQNQNSIHGSATRRPGSKMSPEQVSSSNRSSIMSRKGGAPSPNTYRDPKAKIVKGFSAIDNGFNLNETQFSEKEKIFREKLNKG